MSHPPGVVCVPTGFLARYPAFWTCLMNLVRPKGTNLCVTSGGSIAENRNRGCEIVLANPAYQWLWFIDDDQIFPPEILLNLLERGKDIICGVTPSRSTGSPVVYQFDEAHGAQYFSWETLPLTGLIEETVGGACVLIQRPVLEKVPPPWFAFGQFEGRADKLDEDFYFYNKVRAAGFSICVDTDCVLGHITPTALWPIKTTQGWTVHVDLQVAPAAPGPFGVTRGAQAIA